MVRLVANRPSTVELCPVPRDGNGGQIALANIDAYDLSLAGGCGVRRRNGQRDQQIEALLAPIKPEFRGSYRGPRLEERDMTAPSLVGKVNAPRQCQETDRLPTAQRIIAAQVIGQRGRDVLWGLVQPFKALLGVAQTSGFGVLLDLGPQPFVGGPDLTRDVTGHLGGQTELAAHL